MPEVFKNSENLIEINEDWLVRLKNEAKNSPNLRARLLMHRSGDDTVQEMIIAFCKGASTPVHRSPTKSESLQVLEGAVRVILFDENGKKTHQFDMGPLGSGKTFIYRIGNVPWHQIIPLTDVVVIHESLQGPFEKIDDPAPAWAADLALADAC
jgi:cupin fold WbuC family metalloprotein